MVIYKLCHGRHDINTKLVNGFDKLRSLNLNLTYSINMLDMSIRL